MCGVFDGHGGRNAATFASEHLPEAVNPALARAHRPDAPLDGKAARRAIVEGFAATDAALLEAAGKQGTYLKWVLTTQCVLTTTNETLS